MEQLKSGALDGARGSQEHFDGELTEAPSEFRPPRQTSHRGRETPEVTAGALGRMADRRHGLSTPQRPTDSTEWYLILSLCSPLEGASITELAVLVQVTRRGLVMQLVDTGTTYSREEGESKGGRALSVSRERHLNF